MEQVAERAMRNLTLTLDEAREASSTAVLLWGLGLSGLATGAFFFLLWVLLRACRGLWNRLEAFERKVLGTLLHMLHYC
jgi:hypothetical protein